jgi:hypothetical protein
VQNGGSLLGFCLSKAVRSAGAAQYPLDGVPTQMTTLAIVAPLRGDIQMPEPIPLAEDPSNQLGTPRHK